jgi:hypothetical protein
MVYNTYYGMGYNNTTLIEPKFEMNSYYTQVAQMQFECIYELDKSMLWVRSSDWERLILQDYNGGIEPYAWYKYGQSLEMTYVNRLT